MNLIVSSVDEGVSKHNSIVNSVGVDDWTAERAIIASNVICVAVVIVLSKLKILVK